MCVNEKGSDLGPCQTCLRLAESTWSHLCFLFSCSLLLSHLLHLSLPFLLLSFLSPFTPAPPLSTRQQHKQCLFLPYYHLPSLYPAVLIENHSLFLMSVLSTYMSPPYFQVWRDTLHSDWWILVLLPGKQFLALDGRRGWMEGWMQRADGFLEAPSSWMWTVSFSVSHNKRRLVCQHSSRTSSIWLLSSFLSWLFVSSVFLIDCLS